MRLASKRIVTGYRTQSDDYPNAEKRKTSMNAGIFLSFLNVFYTGNDFFTPKTQLLRKPGPLRIILTNSNPTNKKELTDFTSGQFKIIKTS
jgi:hypothetical protein